MKVITLKRSTNVKTKMDIIKSSESEEQTKLFQWAEVAAHLCGYEGLELMFRIPNEGKRTPYTGGKLKNEGLRTGVSDVCLPVPRGKYHGLFFEMKYGNNKLTTEQRNFLRGVKKQGYATGLCYSADEAISLITKYYQLPEFKEDN